MKKIDMNWDEVFDNTGYLFSFVKSLSAAVKKSPYKDMAEDIVATSGFAFRMWIAEDLCPSETSIWDFSKQKEWVENGGLLVSETNCIWQPEEVIGEERNKVIPKIKESIDQGIPVVAWQVGVCEWGLLTGYDDNARKFNTLCINGSSNDMDYTALGNLEMPMLNVNIVTGKVNREKDVLIADTKALAKTHLQGKEWSENNVSGLTAYKRLISMLEEDGELATSWGMEYALGTYGSLKWYAWKFFEKYEETELADLYHTVFDCWQKAFELKKTTDLNRKENRLAVAELMQKACKCEEEAVEKYFQ